jgi:hypothetical protein
MNQYIRGKSFASETILAEAMGDGEMKSLFSFKTFMGNKQ